MYIDEQTYAPGQAGQEPKVTKLSTLMRIGAALRPQCFGTSFLGGKSCAIGAAYEGAGHRYEEDEGSQGEIYCWLYRTFPQVEYAQTIYAKNDNGWTREAIADWLEGQGL